MHVGMKYSRHEEVRGQLVGVSSLLPPRGSWWAGLPAGTLTLWAVSLAPKVHIFHNSDSFSRDNVLILLTLVPAFVCIECGCIWMDISVFICIHTHTYIRPHTLSHPCGRRCSLLSPHVPIHQSSLLWPFNTVPQVMVTPTIKWFHCYCITVILLLLWVIM